jgi:MoaA/NifB/PqqE/SkfB family radical SAM enzyme
VRPEDGSQSGASSARGGAWSATLEPAARRAPPSPACLQLEPSAACDLRCRMCLACYRRDTAGAPSPFLNLDAFRRLLAELPNLTTLHLQGLGEPFLHPQFLQMVREAADTGLRVVTNTNMRQVHDRKAVECLESGLNTLCVSVDTPDPRTYQAIRGGDLREVAENIRVFIKRREEARMRSPKVVLVAVLMRSTLLQLPGLVRLAAALGADGVSVQNLAQRLTEPDLPAHFDPLRRHVWQESLRSKDVPLANKVFATATSLAEGSGLELKLPSLRPKPPGRPGCEWPWTAMYVTFSGETVPCCMIGLPERVSVGNVFRSGAMNVWAGREMEAFRDRLLDDQPPDVCLGCSVYRREF